MTFPIPGRLPAWAAVLLGATTLLACATDSRTSHALRQQIDQAIGDAACTSNAQCRTLAVGHKACGGPERWLVWSTQRSDGDALQRLAERYNAARRAEVTAEGRVSNCMLELEPAAQCVAGRCAATTRGPLLVE